MQFVSKDIENEFERLSNLYPDLDELSHPMINMSDALRAYFALADYFTDDTSDNTEKMLVGLRSADLLYSALGRQIVSFGSRYKYTNPVDVCSTLFYGMVKNHSFSDGNKRTALLTLLYQLNLYGYLPNVSVNDFERLVVTVAANDLPSKYREVWRKYYKKEDPQIQTISYLLRHMTKKKDHSYHLNMTAKDLVQALEKNDVTCFADKGKLHFERKIPHKMWFGARTLKYTIVFGGWTRNIGAQTVRELLTNLELYEQFPDYQSFIDGQEPYYSLIQDFEMPLRRLKDE